MSNDTPTELLACPFCGAPADSKIEAHSRGCYFRLAHAPDPVPRVELRAAWNRRAPVGDAAPGWADVAHIEHLAEEAECVAMALDKAGAPKDDGHGNSYSLWGRVQQYAAAAQPAKGAPAVELLAWVGRDDTLDGVRIRSVGTAAGVIPACLVDGPSARQMLGHAGMLGIMQKVADKMKAPQQLVRFVAVETVRQVEPARGSNE